MFMKWTNKYLIEGEENAEPPLTDKNSKHSKLLFKLYIAWSIIADLTLVGGIIWGLIYFW